MSKVLAAKAPPQPSPREQAINEARRAEEQGALEDGPLAKLQSGRLAKLEDDHAALRARIAVLEVWAARSVRKPLRLEASEEGDDG
jgi:hypothetical protein